MSRSYSKTLPERATFKRKNNKRFRARCRLCIRKEAANPELGETVFPTYKAFYVLSRWNDHNVKNDIRHGFNLEISQILNGYSYRKNPAMDECFIEAVNEIKGVIPEAGRPYRFEWLEGRKVRKAVKAWRGEPFDVIGHLTRRGFIEQAIRRDLKMRTGK